MMKHLRKPALFLLSLCPFIFLATGFFRDRLGAKPIPIYIPMGQGELFTGIIDLLAMKAYVYHEESHGMTFDEIEIPVSLRDVARDARTELIEAVADHSDTLMERYLNGEEVSGGAACSPATGYLALEAEGALVEFRNLRLRELP